jgi:uncharacterized protein (DUF427 family)
MAQDQISKKLVTRWVWLEFVGSRIKGSIFGFAMSKAIWNGAVLAESDHCEVVEGNYYFPATAINSAYFKESNTHTTCPWKGVASYYDVVVDGKVNKDAAWYYPTPKTAAANIAGYIAFWKGTQVEK